MISRVGRPESEGRGQPFAPGIEVPEGYVLDEFVVEGEAQAYSPVGRCPHGLDGRWDVEPTRQASFHTRFLVLRPVDPQRFDGTVVVNWQNVTVGFEMGAPEIDPAELGHAWVGVTAQKVAIDGYPGTEQLALRGWDSGRYASLTHPGDDFSFDIFTQVASVVGSDRASLGTALDPMGGLPVRRMLATGTSQSALRLRAYVNAVHPLVELFDGFLLYLDMGSGALVDTRAEDLSVPLRIPSAPARIRQDAGVPVMVVNSETEVERLAPALQPDTEAFRLWEIAGAAHVDCSPVGIAERRRALSSVGIDPDERLAWLEGPDLNWMSAAPVHRAALVHMSRWIAGGPAAPAQPRVALVGDRSPTIARDPVGNAVGGVRLPDMEVPLAAHEGVRTGAANVLETLTGRSRILDEGDLRARYASVDAYLDAYRRAVDGCVSSGVVLGRDVPAIVNAAAERAREVITW